MLTTIVALLVAPVIVLAAHDFTDVPNGHTFHNDIDAIYDARITTGCGGGNYCPEAAVSRGQMAAFMHRGLGYAYDDEQPVNVSLTGTQQTIMSITVQAGSVAGGTARVKVDAAVTARITSLTGCPCAAQFTLNGRARTLQIEQLVGSFGIENASITFVDTIPTGVPVTYNVNGFRFSGTGTIFGGGAISAITAPFGS